MSNEKDDHIDPLETQVEKTEGKPPLFSAWESWYFLLILVLAVLVALFYVLTNYYK